VVSVASGGGSGGCRWRPVAWASAKGREEKELWWHGRARRKNESDAGGRLYSSVTWHHQQIYVTNRSRTVRALYSSMRPIYSSVLVPTNLI
jgi:hypothetical protein